MAQIFPDIPKIPFEGPDTRKPLAFRYYDADKKINGKTMKDHFRFSMAFWHSMNAGGVDPFGTVTAIRPWDNITDPMELARVKMRGILS
ncbi:MAG: hypothetical protein WCY01_04265 [Alkalispirochaeta sp.]